MSVAERRRLRWVSGVTREYRIRGEYVRGSIGVICGPKLDTNTGMWRRKFNKELREETKITPIKYYIRGQRIQWFRHIMR
jgi:hypothetical protein